MRMSFVTVVERLPFVQVTVTGHEPVEVLLPIRQVHVTDPPLFAALSPSPDALDGPEAYSTVIEQRAPAAVRAVAVAKWLWETGEESDSDNASNEALVVGLGVVLGLEVPFGSLLVAGADGDGVDSSTASGVGDAAPAAPRSPTPGALSPGAGAEEGDPPPSA